MSLSSGRLSDLQALLSRAAAGSTLDLCGATFSGTLEPGTWCCLFSNMGTGNLVLRAGKVLMRNGKISLPDGCKVCVCVCVHWGEEWLAHAGTCALSSQSEGGTLWQCFRETKLADADKQAACLSCGSFVEEGGVVARLAHALPRAWGPCH